MQDAVIYSAQRTPYHNEVSVLTWTDDQPQAKVQPLPPPPGRVMSGFVPGYNWGYEGAGPSILSISILSHALEDPEAVLDLAYDFKVDVIAKQDSDHWSVDQSFVRQWAERQRAAREPAIAVAA